MLHNIFELDDRKHQVAVKRCPTFSQFSEIAQSLPRSVDFPIRTFQRCCMRLQRSVRCGGSACGILPKCYCDSCLLLCIWHVSSHTAPLRRPRSRRFLHVISWDNRPTLTLGHRSSPIFCALLSSAQKRPRHPVRSSRIGNFFFARAFPKIGPYQFSVSRDCYSRLT